MLDFTLFKIESLTTELESTMVMMSAAAHAICAVALVVRALGAEIGTVRTGVPFLLITICTPLGCTNVVDTDTMNELAVRAVKVEVPSPATAVD